MLQNYLYFLRCDSVDDLRHFKRSDLKAYKANSCFPFSVRTPVNLADEKKDTLIVCLYAGKKHSVFITHTVLHFHPKELKFKGILQTTQEFYVRKYSLITY
jgi:hypothetical protein